MAVHSSPTNKRKNPPTFRHLPRNRALKLKKSWVEKKKLQARWRAQKRKESLGPLRRGENVGLEEATDSESRPERDPRHLESPRTRKRKIADDGDDESGSEANFGSSSHADARDSEDSSSVVDGDLDSERPPLRRKKARTTVPQVDEVEPESTKRFAKSKGTQLIHPPSKGDITVKRSRDDNDQPSLREMTRRAYAPSSLHTFKADPLHRRKDAVTSHRLDEGNPAKRKASRPSAQAVELRRDRAHGRQGHQGRGQPNMKLRMEAMLERIKRDYP